MSCWKADILCTVRMLSGFERFVEGVVHSDVDSFWDSLVHRLAKEDSAPLHLLSRERKGGEIHFLLPSTARW